MDDATLVSGVERIGDLSGDVPRFVDRYCPMQEAVGQRQTFDELEDQRTRVVAALVGAVVNTVDGADVLVVQRRFGFPV